MKVFSLKYSRIALSVPQFFLVPFLHFLLLPPTLAVLTVGSCFGTYVLRLALRMPLCVSVLALVQTSSPSTPGSHLAPCVPVNNGPGTRAQYRSGTPSNPPSTLPGTTVPGTTTPCVAQDGTVVTPSSSGTTGTAMQSGSQGSSGSQSGSSQPGPASGGQSSGSGAQSPSGNSPGTNQQNS